jgi:hypothetical protein
LPKRRLYASLTSEQAKLEAPFDGDAAGTAKLRPALDGEVAKLATQDSEETVLEGERERPQVEIETRRTDSFPQVELSNGSNVQWELSIIQGTIAAGWLRFSTAAYPRLASIQ